MRRVDSLEKTLMLGGIGGRRRGDDRGWNGWMASPTWWMWVWVNSGSWWWTGRPGVLWFMGMQRVEHDWVTELNWTELNDILLFPTLFNLSLNLAIRSSWSKRELVLFLLTVLSFSIFGCKEYNQSDFGVDHLVMSMCRVFSCVSGKWCLLRPVHSLGRTLLAFVLLHSVLQGQICPLLQEQG